MSKRKIILFPGKAVGLGVYVRAWKNAKELPGDTILPYGPGSWSPITVDECLRRMRASIHDRINKHVKTYGVGRKWKSDWQISAWRDSRKLRDHADRRVRFYQLETAEARGRFSHLLARHDD